MDTANKAPWPTMATRLLPGGAAATTAKMLSQRMPPTMAGETREEEDGTAGDHNGMDGDGDGNDAGDW